MGVRLFRDGAQVIPSTGSVAAGPNDLRVAAAAGMLTVTGRNVGTEARTISRLQIHHAWAPNIHATNVHLWPFMQKRDAKAQAGGNRPLQDAHCESADWYLPISSGDGRCAGAGR